MRRCDGAPVRTERVLTAVLAALASGCSAESRLANAADDLENASEHYANGTDDRLEKIGNRVAPALERTIDRFDGDAGSSATNAAEIAERADKK